MEAMWIDGSHCVVDHLNNGIQKNSRHSIYKYKYLSISTSLSLLLCLPRASLMQPMGESSQREARVYFLRNGEIFKVTHPLDSEGPLEVTCVRQEDDTPLRHSFQCGKRNRHVVSHPMSIQDQSIKSLIKRLASQCLSNGICTVRQASPSIMFASIWAEGSASDLKLRRK